MQQEISLLYAFFKVKIMELRIKLNNETLYIICILL